MYVHGGGRLGGGRGQRGRVSVVMVIHVVSWMGIQPIQSPLNPNEQRLFSAQRQVLEACGFSGESKQPGTVQKGYFFGCDRHNDCLFYQKGSLLLLFCLAFRFIDSTDNTSGAIVSLSAVCIYHLCLSPMQALRWQSQVVFFVVVVVAVVAVVSFCVVLYYFVLYWFGLVWFGFWFWFYFFVLF